MSRWAKGTVLAVLLMLCVLGADARAVRPCIPRSQCCRICEKGRACGNSCIHATFNCYKGRGCACDSSEVCR
jgi:hypothetical protein